MDEKGYPYLESVIDLIVKSHPELTREDIKADLLKRVEPKVYPDPMQPPWVACPWVTEWPSMGWNMGGGEDYLMAFTPWFRALSREERDAYMRDNPEPDAYSGMYRIIDR